MRRVLIAVASLALLASAASARPSSAPTRSARVGVAGEMPQIGADLVNTDPVLPHCWNGSIVPDYGKPGVRAQMQDDLAAMRAAGLQTFRIFLYHEHGDPVNTNVMSSTGGRLSEPFRTNLINLLTDVRKAGFLQVTLVFNPWGENDPIEAYTPGVTYDPSLFDENWAFIRDVRPLLKQYGPPSTHVDLLNEGAPSTSQATFAQVEDYIARMYANYVDAFGSDDVTVSVIAQFPGDWTRLQNLIDTLRATGKPLPRWFDVHPLWNPADQLQDLRAIDAELTANGLSQPLVIGEDKYNAPAAAAAIAEFMRTSSRRVIEVMEWPNIVEGPVVQPSCPHPPYRIDAYWRALKGATPSTRLSAVLTDRSLRFVTPYGQPVTALEAGRFTVSVKDQSRRRGFYLDRQKTSARFRGSVLWRVTLSPGTHRYGVIGQPRGNGTVAILAPG